MEKIIDIIIIITMLIGVYFAYEYYHKNSINQFNLSEKNLYTSNFAKSQDEKYLDKTTYKITSEEYNDAMFYKTIKVEKETTYKVTCMVKTNNVKSENDLLGSGAQISIEDTTERSVAVQGTQDWQKIELIFNSKNREEINIGFRLGGYIDCCTGEAWFSDFHIEKGTVENKDDTNWKFACFIFDSVNVEKDGETLNYTLSTDNVADMKNTINRFENACAELSNDKMSATCDTYKISTPITSLSYDDEYGYFVAPEDVEEQIKATVDSNDYDHIFIIFKLDDQNVNDWIGLGAMDYYGIGFSNIRLPNEENSYIYKYDTQINQFPEEVLMHEFLHSLERTLDEYGYEIPELHSYEEHGYRNNILTGLKKWYTDYMNCKIKTDDGNVGLYEIVYTLKPAKSSNFNISEEIENAFDEPQGIVDEITQLFETVGKNLKLIIETI